MTASTWSGRGSEVSSTSAASATSVADFAGVPPAIAISLRGSTTRSKALTSYPAASSRRHMGFPMLPRPMKPIVSDPVFCWVVLAGMGPPEALDN